MAGVPVWCWIAGVVLAAAVIREGPSWEPPTRVNPLSNPAELDTTEETTIALESGDVRFPPQPARVDGPKALNQYEKQALEDDPERILRLRAWCEADPEAMTAWVVSHLAGKDRVTALKQAAVVWFSVDSDSATRWAGSLVEDTERNTVLLEIGFEMARLQPEGAVDLASKLPFSPTRDELLLHSVRQWAGVDPSAASVWASRLPESRLRQEVFSALAVSLAVDNGQDAAGIVARSIASGKEQEDSAVLVARSWGTLDPESAADWIVGFQDLLVREAAMRELVAVWVERSPEHMSSWIGSLADESLRLQMMDVVGSVRRQARPVLLNPAVGISP